MIPLRVKLKGFLCYKDEQEVSFDGSSLWMLSGLNGSGKSAVFDGVTYGLFGHHRGGSTQAQELVNKNSDGFEVEFDFLQDGQAYRIHRTLRKKARGGNYTTQQIYRRVHTNGSGEGKWEAVADTTRKTDFDAWVRDNIGLSYETFTSSVLLLQGKAEKLLDSSPRGRFEVLAGIVDLDRYMRLHERADNVRRDYDVKCKSLNHQLETLPEISAAEVLEAQAKVEAAERTREQAWKEVERLQALEYQAKMWLEKSEQLRQVQQKLRQTEGLLAEAKEIEQDLARLKELQAVLPGVKSALEQRHGIEEAERRLRELEERQRKVGGELARQEEELAKARHTRTHLETTLQKEEQQLRDIANELRSATVLLEKLKEYERQEQALAPSQEELKRLPENPQADVKQAREKCDLLAGIAQVVPQLVRLHEVREQLRHAMQQEKDALAKKQEIEKHGKQIKAEVEKLKTEMETAIKARQDVDNQVTEAKTILKQAQQDLQELLLLRGAKVCRHCGQELTPAHVAEEKVRREATVQHAQEKYQKLVEQQKKIHADEKSLRIRHDEVENRRQAAREDFRTCSHRVEEAEKDLQRLRGECNRIYEGLPEDFREKISAAAPADWLQTAYPTIADLKQLRSEASELEPARQCLREAEAVLQKWNQLKAQEMAILQNLQRMQAELPADRATLRQKHARLEAEEKSLQESVDALKASLEENRRGLEKLAQKREAIQQEVNKCAADIQTQTAAKKNCRQIFDRAVKDLSEAWKERIAEAGLGDLYGWERERDRLVENETEKRFEQLRDARLAVAGFKEESERLQKQISELPEEAREGPSAVLKSLQSARDRHKEADEMCRQDQQKLALLEHQQRQREQIQKDKLEADENLKHAKLLAELLGRDRLQRYLVRQAERHVVDHANSVLDRLSGGELYLRLCGEAGGEGNAAKALELEAHNRITGEQPINVAFLSGSQKFRVAVSLALGIGQYASRQHRPIESVIIDEGFGCLDKNARQVMIQELQNLRSQMRCILLVSHQEEFADAFSDGYYFELQEGTTVAKRFQR